MVKKKKKNGRSDVSDVCHPCWLTISLIMKKLKISRNFHHAH